MLCGLEELLTAAEKGKYAIGQFNLNGFAWIKAALAAAEKSHSPLILGVTEAAARELCGYETVAEMVRCADRAMHIRVPVVLHADHASLDAALSALRAGFGSVMYDGSAEPVEENLRKTEHLVRAARPCGAAVEAEAGSIAGCEDGLEGRGEIADPEDCRRLASCGITILAAGIGNQHGVYPENWKGLAFEALHDIRKATGDLPLALHGGSGIPASMLQRAIAEGIRKINVNTECKQSFCLAVAAEWEQTHKKCDPAALERAGVAAIAKTVQEKMMLFGCLGKA